MVRDCRDDLLMVYHLARLSGGMPPSAIIKKQPPISHALIAARVHSKLKEKCCSYKLAMADAEAAKEGSATDSKGDSKEASKKASKKSTSPGPPD
jgi:hypothetical protein